MSEPPSVDRAVALAHELHRTQTRKGTAIPYVTHLWAVASLVGEHGGSEVELAAAWLHDAVEDQGGAPTLARIRAECGDEVARLVAACSDTDVTPKPPWRARKQAYLDGLEGADRSTLLVSCADKLHNARATLLDLRELGPEVFERFNGGREGTLWYYEAVAEVFARRLPGPLARELGRVVDALGQVASGHRSA